MSSYGFSHLPADCPSGTAGQTLAAFVQGMIVGRWQSAERAAQIVEDAGGENAAAIARQIRLSSPDPEADAEDRDADDVTICRLGREWIVSAPGFPTSLQSSVADAVHEALRIMDQANVDAWYFPYDDAPPHFMINAAGGTAEEPIDTSYASC